MKRRRRPAVEEALFATAINVTPTESLLLFELRPARSLGRDILFRAFTSTLNACRTVHPWLDAASVTALSAGG